MPRRTATLLDQLQFDPQNDVLVSVGDIIDRGPKIRETIEYLFALPRFHMVLGNHEDKFVRYLQGNNVKPTGGMQTTIDAYESRFPPELVERLRALPLIIKTPSGYVVHAGFDPEMPPEEQGRAGLHLHALLWGKTYFDEINGRAWYTLWPHDAPRVFFGHIPIEDGPAEGNVIALDAGCVFGGHCTSSIAGMGRFIRLRRKKHTRSANMVWRSTSRSGRYCVAAKST